MFTLLPYCKQKQTKYLSCTLKNTIFEIYTFKTPYDPLKASLKFQFEICLLYVPIVNKNKNNYHESSKTQYSKYTPSKTLYESMKPNICHLFENSTKGV